MDILFETTTDQGLLLFAMKHRVGVHKFAAVHLIKRGHFLIDMLMKMIKVTKVGYSRMKAR